MVEYLLIFLIVALPVVGVIAWFWKSIAASANTLWQQIAGGQTTEPPAQP